MKYSCDCPYTHDCFEASIGIGLLSKSEGWIRHTQCHKAWKVYYFLTNGEHTIKEITYYHSIFRIGMLIEEDFPHYKVDFIIISGIGKKLDENEIFSWYDEYDIDKTKRQEEYFKSKTYYMKDFDSLPDNIKKRLVLSLI